MTPVPFGMVFVPVNVGLILLGVCFFRPFPSPVLPNAVIEEIRKSNRTPCLPFTTTSVKKEKDDALAWTFDQVHLLQSDIVGFTKCAPLSFNKCSRAAFLYC